MSDRDPLHGFPLPPSQDTERYWIYAVCMTGTVPEASDADVIGKWLIFRDAAEIDAVWLKVAAAVQEGKLGIAAKVSTRFGAAMHGNRHVICVYTHDWTDAVCVRQVRQALRDIGFVEKLGYKTDADSRAGLYGDREVFKYEE